MLQTIKRYQFKTIGDTRGKLIALEMFSAQVPFDVKRVYYLFDTQFGAVRGKHAHKQLKQLLICVSGSCLIHCDFGDGRKMDYILDTPDQGLLIEGLVWREMKLFSKGAVLLVLASDHYDEADYIRKYGSFLEEVKNGKRNSTSFS